MGAHSLCRRAATNGNPIQNWTDRNLPSNYTYAGARAAPWEVIFALAK